MDNRTCSSNRWWRTAGVIAVACALLLAGATGSALAAGVGGGRGGGGGHMGFAGRGGGFAGRGFAGRGFAGYGRGWYGRGWYGPGWGWGWGLGLGLWLTALPWDYYTYWWDGVPYYYADDNYYVWNGDVGQYEAVQPPPQVAQQAAAQPPESTELFAYPEKNQSEQQQATDKEQCRSWARGQSGYNPADAGGTVVPGTAAPGAAAPEGPAASGNPAPGASAAETQLAQRSAYLRAEAACLQARGYSVR